MKDSPSEAPRRRRLFGPLPMAATLLALAAACFARLAAEPTGLIVDGRRPMAGNPQAGMAYPPVWVAWWLRAPAALGWLTVAHLLWGGLGTYVRVPSGVERPLRPGDRVRLGQHILQVETLG